jgi:small GTP-binding protein
VTVLNKKVCLLGDFAVGKTSLLRRFIYDRFDDKYISTIGVKVSRKTVSIADDQGVVELRMMLWDLAGSEEFDQIRASYLRGAAGAILVCDTTRSKTLDNLPAYVDDLLSSGARAKVIVAANKCDLITQQELTSAQIEAAAEAIGAPHYFTSAKTGTEVEMLFRHLGQLLLAKP